MGTGLNHDGELCFWAREPAYNNTLVRALDQAALIVRHDYKGRGACHAKPQVNAGRGLGPAMSQ